MLLRGRRVAAALHMSNLLLQLGPSLLAVFEASLGVAQPQQLLLQQAVLSLQQGELADGSAGGGLAVLPPGTRRRRRRCVFLLQEQLQDGVLLDDSSLQATRIMGRGLLFFSFS